MSTADDGSVHLSSQGRYCGPRQSQLLLRQPQAPSQGVPLRSLELAILCPGEPVHHGQLFSEGDDFLHGEAPDVRYTELDYCCSEELLF